MHQNKIFSAIYRCADVKRFATSEKYAVFFLGKLFEYYAVININAEVKKYDNAYFIGWYTHTHTHTHKALHRGGIYLHLSFTASQQFYF